MLARKIFINVIIHMCSAIVLLSSGCYNKWVPTATGINEYYGNIPVEEDWTKVSCYDIQTKVIYEQKQEEDEKQYSNADVQPIASKEKEANDNDNKNELITKQTEYENEEIKTTKRNSRHNRKKSTVRSASAPAVMQTAIK